MLAFWFFQLVFAGTAATIVSGGMAERTKFSSYIIVSIIVTAIIYPIFGHWTWGGGWLTKLPFGDGFSDFAGSTIVHSVGGWIALVGAMMLGPRIGRFEGGKSNPIPGHSVPLAALGVFILWIGWYGFNAGSELAAVGGSADAIALIASNTTISAAAGAVGAMMISWMLSGKPNAAVSFNGVIGGLVAITAPCAQANPGQSIIIGLVGGAIVIFGMMALEALKIDDPVSVVPAHLFAGIWGTLAVGLFPFSFEQLLAQIIGIVAAGVWCVGTSYILFATLKATMGLRVSKEEELMGLDYGEHGAVAYPDINSIPQPAAEPMPAASGVSRAPAK
jgi:Amt family ammonium transporter